jgi:hypothetical protein
MVPICCRLSVVSCRLLVHWRLPTGDCRLATGDWRLPTGDWRLATGDWRLATADCPSLFALRSPHKKNRRFFNSPGFGLKSYKYSSDQKFHRGSAW